MAREKWHVRNRTRKVIGIGDLKFVPAIKPGERVDLLRFHTYAQIEQSVDLANLISIGWLTVTKTKTKVIPSIDRTEVDEIDAKDAVTLENSKDYTDDVDTKIDNLVFIDLLDVPKAYAGDENKVLSVKADATGVTFTNVTSGAPSGLDDIPDVTITSPANNERIVFDANSGQWVNRANPEEITHVTTTPYTLTENSGVYLVDTGVGDITVNIPAVDAFNDGERIRVYKTTSDSNSVTVQVTGQAQLVGGSNVQTIDQDTKGFSVIADWNGGSSPQWQIVQDSRFLAGSTEGSLQFWNATGKEWAETETYLRYITATRSIRLSSGVDVNAILDEDNMSTDSETSLATQQSIKAYVDTEIAAAEGAPTVTVVSKTTDYAATATDNYILCDASSGQITITLPAATSGKILHIKKTDSSGNNVIIDGNGSETIDDELTKIITAQYTAIAIVSDGSNWSIF